MNNEEKEFKVFDLLMAGEAKGTIIFNQDPSRTIITLTEVNNNK